MSNPKKRCRRALSHSVAESSWICRRLTLRKSVSMSQDLPRSVAPLNSDPASNGAPTRIIIPHIFSPGQHTLHHFFTHRESFRMSPDRSRSPAPARTSAIGPLIIGLARRAVSSTTSTLGGVAVGGGHVRKVWMWVWSCLDGVVMWAWSCLDGLVLIVLKFEGRLRPRLQGLYTNVAI